MRSQAIWHPAALAVYIRLEFHLSSAAAKGLLRCAASGPYEVYLNGERVGRGLGPAVAEVAMWEQFALDAALREGENVLLVFAIGCGAADWFRAEGKIERSDGAEQVLYTGALAGAAGRCLGTQLAMQPRWHRLSGPKGDLRDGGKRLWWPEPSRGIGRRCPRWKAWCGRGRWWLLAR